MIISDLLQKSVANAECVIWYAAEHGIDVDPLLVTTIINTRAAVTSGAITPAEEVVFWSSLDELARLVKPASIEGVAARYLPDHLNAQDGAPRLLRRHRRAAYLVFAGLLILQSFCLVGAAAVKRATELATLVDAAQDQDTRARLDVEEKLDTELKALASLPITPEEREARGTAIQAVYDREKARNAGQFDVVKERLENEGAATEQLITRWNMMNPLWWAIAARASSGDDRFLADLEVAKFGVEALQHFLLPLMFGWLGACLFVMRKLSREFDEMSISNASGVVYAMRQALGALAGVAIGLFFGPEVGSAVTSTLPPLALAFLAGYSVEVLFGAMDRLVEAFTRTEART